MNDAPRLLHAAGTIAASDGQDGSCNSATVGLRDMI